MTQIESNLLNFKYQMTRELNVALTNMLTEMMTCPSSPAVPSAVANLIRFLTQNFDQNQEITLKTQPPAISKKPSQRPPAQPVQPKPVSREDQPMSSKEKTLLKDQIPQLTLT